MNYFNYFTEIEAEFVKRRGSHLLVSSLDWSLIETWKQRGVPLHIVLRGINVSFDAYDQKAHRGRKVNSLFYCQQEVEASFLQYCDAHVGSNGDGGDGTGEQANGSDGATGGHSTFTKPAIIDYLTEHRGTLQRLGAKHSSTAPLGETLARTAERLGQIIEDLSSANTFSPESIEVDLTMIEEVIFDGLKESAGEEPMALLEKQAHRELQAYRRTMEKEIYQQTLDNFIARRLREQFHIPRLSLFYL
ncbi:MAG TPA: hypothetical protein VJ302_17355 [Blastocatellia bacterium]|nr:hypothetical protein [Blastocatellia bacterium]